MVHGSMPADGEVQLGSVRLPAGERICVGTRAEGFTDVIGPASMAAIEAEAYEHAEPGAPLLWATTDPVPDVGHVWLALHEIAPETGLVPITLAFLHDGTRVSRGRPWDSGELSGPYPLADADGLDVPELLAENWEDSLEHDEDDPWELEQIAPFSWGFPGMAPAADKPLSRAEVAAALGQLGPARLGLVPASRPADVLMLTGFSGMANGFGTPAEFTAVLRSWEERFGAVLFQVGFADVRLLVTRPPRTQRVAEAVAAEIYTMSNEFWPIERPGTALTTVGEIAAYVKDAPFWGFWWD
jgi:Domain of unknown function (DUF4253)